MTKQYDPNWPFPQFDEDGVQLLPADFDMAPPPKYKWLEEAEDALM
jgi:hypothetical protein